MQNKKLAATILLVVFLFIPLASAANDWGISKDWTLADPNATLPPVPTPTATPQVNSSATPNPSSSTTTTPTPTATPIGQTPSPTPQNTLNPSVTPFLQTYNPASLPITIIVAITLLGISIPTAIYLVAKSKRHGEATYE